MLLLATSCANPKRSAIRYSPPSFTPIREKITDAQTSASGVKNAIEKAQSLVGQDSVDPKNVPDLNAALADAHRFVEALGGNLVGAQEKTNFVESASKNQTVLLNNAIDEKNAAITERDVAVRKYHGLKFLVCLLAAGAVLSLAWRLRGLLAFIPPPYNFVAIGALPLITFTFLWVAEPWEWIWK